MKIQKPMSYRIPKDYEIAKAIANCLSRTPRIRSQSVLNELILTELACVDETFRVSGERIRKVGLKKKLFDLEIRYARIAGKSPYTKCPVCGGELKTVQNKTLDGGTVEMARSCKACGYYANTDAVKPARYIIVRRE